MIGETSHDGSIIIAVVRPAVGLDYGPVRQVGEDEIRRILDTVFALGARAAAQRHVARHSKSHARQYHSSLPPQARMLPHLWPQ